MRLDLKTRVFTFVVVVSNLLGNLALTWGLKRGGENLSGSPLAYLKAIFSPYVMLGISLLIVWLLTRMTLLSWADLSYVLPVTSVGYAITVVLGKYFFAEKITPARWAGTLLIMAGMALVGPTSPRTTPATVRSER